MPYSINIHAHVDDHEVVLELLEKLDECAGAFSVSYDNAPPIPAEDEPWASDATPEARLGRLVRDVERDERIASAMNAAPEIGQISQAIYNAGKALILECDIEGEIVAHELQNLCHVVSEGSDLSRFASGDDSGTWWLIVIWAMQDWHARGVELDAMLAMTRGIIADLQGALS